MKGVKYLFREDWEEKGNNKAFYLTFIRGLGGVMNTIVDPGMVSKCR